MRIKPLPIALVALVWVVGLWACAQAQVTVKGGVTTKGGVTVGVTVAPSNTPLTEPLLSSGDVSTYVGCVYFDPADGKISGSAQGGWSAGLDPSNNHLYVAGQGTDPSTVPVNPPSSYYMAEFTFPPAYDPLCAHGAADSTYFLTRVGNWVDPSEGKADDVCQNVPEGCSGLQMDGILPIGSNIFYTFRSIYESRLFPRGMFKRPKDLTDTGHVTGPYGANGVDSERRWAGSLDYIPEAGWRTLLGGCDVATAAGFVSVDASAVQAPGIWCFNSGTFAANFPITQFAYSNPDQTGLFVYTQRTGGHRWIPGTRTVIVSQRNGIGFTSYGVSSGEHGGSTFAGSGTGTAWNIDAPGTNAPFVGNVSTSSDGRTITVPNFVFGSLPGDYWICIEGETVPQYADPDHPTWYPGCALIDTAANSGTPSASVHTFDHAFTGGLVNKTAHLGQIILFNPVLGRGTGGFNSTLGYTSELWFYDAKCFYDYTLCGFSGTDKVIPYDIKVWDTCSNATANAGNSWLPTCITANGEMRAMLYIPKDTLWSGGPYLLMKQGYATTIYFIFTLSNVP